MAFHQNETIHLFKFPIDSELLGVFIIDEDTERWNMTASWKDKPRTKSNLDNVELCFEEPTEPNQITLKHRQYSESRVSNLLYKYSMEKWFHRKGFKSFYGSEAKHNFMLL